MTDDNMPGPTPLVQSLLDLADMIDNAKVEPSCSCGWIGKPTRIDDEATLEGWEHDHYAHEQGCDVEWKQAWCDCGWVSDTYYHPGNSTDPEAEARLVADAHEPCTLPPVEVNPKRRG